MTETITIREYDFLLIKDKRDIKNRIISKDDAFALESIIMEEEPIFKWGYNKISAQHWVGSISLNNLNIEILPKLADYVDNNTLRQVLTRMLLISHQSPAIKNMPSNTQMTKNSLLEMLIDTFLNSFEHYLKGGMQHSYQKIDKNINKIKGQILFNKQFSKNVLKIDRFWCKYSKFTSNNPLNQFFKLCLTLMNQVTTDHQNQIRIKYLLPLFDEISTITKDTALLKEIVFNSTNYRAENAYQYGRLFLQNIYSSLNAGNTKINMVLFDMNMVYERFIYKATKFIYRSNVNYQLRGNFAVIRDTDKRKYIALRPDITIKRASNSYDIIDTKWKIPKVFSKESDIYQMNAYSTCIPNINKIYLLYPFVGNNSIVNDYHFIDKNDNQRVLKIRTVDLCKCLNWNLFLQELKVILD